MFPLKFKNPKTKNHSPYVLRTGFTLLETLIVVVIVIIMAAVAIPSFERLFASQRLQSVAFQMVQDLREAREDAILYQQDLNVYFNFDNSPVEPLSSTNFNNREYFYETFQKDPLAIPPEHYTPEDTLNTKFKRRIMKYDISIESITASPSSSINFSGKNYFVLTFRSGAGDTFRGEADITTNMDTTLGTNTVTQKINSPYVITIKLKDLRGNNFYVFVNNVGKVWMNGSP